LVHVRVKGADVTNAVLHATAGAIQLRETGITRYCAADYDDWDGTTMNFEMTGINNEINEQQTNSSNQNRKRKYKSK
jgi:hypothetical protein